MFLIMGSTDEVVEVDFLERHLLSGSDPIEDSEIGDESVLYRASFQEMEDKFVKYQTARWILYSLCLILAWGIGFFMLLYIPVRRCILRKDFRSRELYVTSNAIVYKVTRPILFPCFGVLKKEKHVLLPSVADILIEQGYLQSLFGIYSVRIENAGVRRPRSDDVKIQGIAHPSAFRKAVLTQLSNLRSENFARQVSTNEDLPNLGSNYPPMSWVCHNSGTSFTSQQMSPSKSLGPESLHSSGELILQKLEEVGSSVKRVQTIIEERHYQAAAQASIC